MKSNEIIQILQQMNENNIYKKIFINGAWGIGKSYYTNEYIKDNKENFVYVSLYGKTSFESINDALAKELMQKLNTIDKGKKEIKEFLKKISGSVTYKGCSINSPKILQTSLISDFGTLLDSKSLIIVIDDLERKSGKILMEDIMGMIEEFSKFEKVKLVIIGDENNINETDLEKWQKYKEKIIEKEYNIKCYSDDSINNLIRKKIINYIDSNEIKKFINNFIKNHNIINLRTIIKGINFFEEVVKNYVKIKNNKKLNLMLLKNCMAIVIEKTEEKYKPDEKIKKNNPFLYSLDEDILIRINNHYFNSVSFESNDSCALEYLLNIYNCDFDEKLLKDFNETIKYYLNVKVNEKEFFYLSEKQIMRKIQNIYKNMNNGTYEFSTINQFIDDIYQIIIWNDTLNLNIKYEDISRQVNKILFKNFYDSKKDSGNIIDQFDLKIRESKDLKSLIDNYNKIANLKILEDKFSTIEKNYKTKKYKEDSLDWLDIRLVQEDKKEVMEKFIIKCRNNNFFIPKISGEINEQTWKWTHKIWKLFYERMDYKYKIELNNYVESLKSNKISSYRIKSLQEYRPLIDKKTNDK